MVQRLKNFIDNDKEYRIALVAGVRRTGKTTILKQLQGYYPDAVYIDLSKSDDGYLEIEERFLDNPSGLLLLDEISYLGDYEMISQSLYNLSSKQFKVIITGSSPAHVIKLAGSKLGGGRSKLFRLPLLTFAEYLYFTNKIKSYTDYQSVTHEHFIDYLRLKDIGTSEAPDLAVTFNDEYFDSFYNDNSVSNSNTRIIYSKIQLKPGDLEDLLNLIAYKLSEACSFQTIIRPNPGGQERINLRDSNIRVKWNQIDLSDAIISESSRNIINISAERKGRILRYLLDSGLAYITYREISPGFSVEDQIDAGSVLNILSSCTKESQLINLFGKLSINIISPLFYTRIGADILNRAGVSLDFLCTGMLLGKMLEMYLYSGVLSWYNSSVLVGRKLNYEGLKEVDIYDKKNFMLLESTISNKKAHEIGVYQYFKAGNYIRVCTSKDNDFFDGRYYQVPYAKLCCMTDTGDIFKLNRTVV